MFHRVTPNKNPKYSSLLITNHHAEERGRPYTQTVYDISETPPREVYSSSVMPWSTGNPQRILYGDYLFIQTSTGAKWWNLASSPAAEFEFSNLTHLPPEAKTDIPIGQCQLISLFKQYLLCMFASKVIVIYDFQKQTVVTRLSALSNAVSHHQSVKCIKFDYSKIVVVLYPGTVDQLLALLLLKSNEIIW